MSVAVVSFAERYPQRAPAIRPVPAREDVSDEELIARISWRDESALATLYSRYADTIYGLSLRIVRQIEVAEEVVQETFMRVWRGAPSFQGNAGGLRSWLFRIARNLSLDQLRRQAARPRTVTITPDPVEERSPLDTLADEKCDVAVQATDRCVHEQVRRALMTLPPEQRHALELAYFSGMTHREIAEATGEPLGTIKTRLRLGLQKLAVIAEQESFAR
jgi:RNA polymerase sigma-70 factor (ECF subfamily)